MKDLERLTGVGREAIRFYIREGLLPEPSRPARNVAVYDSAFVERIRLIKKLQSERFLPLGIIRGLLDGNQPPSPAESDVLAGLDGVVAGNRSAHRSRPSETVEVLADRLGIPVSELSELEKVGAIDIVGRGAKARIEGDSIQLAEQWSRLRRAGFRPELGFGPKDLEIYTQFMDWLVREEVRLVTERLGGRTEPERLREMITTALSTVADVLGLLHQRAVDKAIAEVGRPAGRTRSTRAR